MQTVCAAFDQHSVICRETAERCWMEASSMGTVLSMEGLSLQDPLPASRYSNLLIGHSVLIDTLASITVQRGANHCNSAVNDGAFFAGSIPCFKVHVIMCKSFSSTTLYLHAWQDVPALLSCATSAYSLLMSHIFAVMCTGNQNSPNAAAKNCSETGSGRKLRSCLHSKQVLGTSFSGNAGTNGGAMAMQSVTNASFTDVSAVSNIAGCGGGVFIDRAASIQVPSYAGVRFQKMSISCDCFVLYKHLHRAASTHVPIAHQGCRLSSYHAVQAFTLT